MKKVILYSTGCPRCNVLKSKMNSKGIQYIENSDTEEMLRKGFTQVPVLEADGKFMDFAEANEWVNEQERVR